MDNNGSILLNAVFDEFVKHGSEMFCGMRLAPTELEHCQIYYDFMNPPTGATVVDLGCGIGGCGAYLQKIDPSLEIINVVNEAPLIAEMKRLGRVCINASFENTPLPNNFADVVMFNESIGYGDLGKVLKEASRLLKIGGILTIKDFSPLDPSKEVIGFDEWDYYSHRPDIVLNVAYRNNLSIDKLQQPKIYMDHWDKIMGDNMDAKRVLGEDTKLLPLSQTLYRFIKGNLSGRS
jgi:ubiquinone/menaquinone biosynthesis C-methylase UbiE